MTPFLVELYKMAQTPPQDPQPVRNTPAPKKKNLGQPPSGAQGDPNWNNNIHALPLPQTKAAQAKSCGGKGQPTCETVKGETQEQRTKRILREGSEEGLMSDKKSSGAEMLYSRYCDVMNQLYGG